MRMTSNQLEILLQIVYPMIQRADTNMRDPTPAKIKLNQYEVNNTQNETTIEKIRNNVEEKNERVSSFRRILPQVLAGSAKNLLLFDLGAVFGFQTIIIGNILNATSQPSFTEDESSWFASLLFIAQPIGCLLSAIILEPIGRKRSMIFLNIPLFIGWFMMSTAQSVPVLYIGSFLLGLGLGFMEAPTITYIGEITEPKMRGIMTSYAELIIGVGTLVVYFLGVLFDWRTVAYMCTAIPVVSALAIAFVPESPIWLLAKNRTEEAEQALCWLRGWVTPEFVQEEFSELVLYKNNKISMNNDTSQSELNYGHSNTIDINDENSQKDHEYNDDKYENIEDKHKNLEERHDKIRLTKIGVVNKSSLRDKERLVEYEKDDEIKNFNLGCENNKLNTTKGKMIKSRNIISDLLEPHMLRTLLLMIGFFFLTTATGANVVQAYAIPVFKELGFTIEPFKANVVTGVALTLGQLTLMVIVRCLGKRKIVLFSTLGCAVSCAAIGFYALQTNTIATGSWSFPFIIYTVNNYVYGLGLSPIPYMYLSEVFPFRGRGAATAISASMNYMFGFLVTKTFFTMKGALTLAGTFFFYGLISLFGFVYLYFLLPETEGKTLQDIEEEATQIKKSKA